MKEYKTLIMEDYKSTSPIRSGSEFLMTNLPVITIMILKNLKAKEILLSLPENIQGI